ncbi:MAG: D-tyrosyl-tRNA(Tyr) deacylase [Nitratiruptor sp.]|nr:D-tyrosyl-tRNA(Tyr) deacylase [Nitratiruptor sp.]NPA82968.1 D-tyrosyl-tRNA(Tyr) deacylase [Campylobacterota bacterium]
MRAIVQRVTQSWVSIDNREVARIGRGINILLGVMEGDTSEESTRLAAKIAKLRIFPNEQGRFDRSLIDIGGEALVVSQFTLAATIKSGNRPDFHKAMAPSGAKELYQAFIDALQSLGVPVQTGVFGGMMEVGIVNDGPVTIILDTKEF